MKLAAICLLAIYPSFAITLPTPSSNPFSRPAQGAVDHENTQTSLHARDAGGSPKESSFQKRFNDVEGSISFGQHNPTPTSYRAKEHYDPESTFSSGGSRSKPDSSARFSLNLNTKFRDIQVKNLEGSNLEDVGRLIREMFELIVYVGKSLEIMTQPDTQVSGIRQTSSEAMELIPKLGALRKTLSFLIPNRTAEVKARLEEANEAEYEMFSVLRTIQKDVSEERNVNNFFEKLEQLFSKLYQASDAIVLSVAPGLTS